MKSQDTNKADTLPRCYSIEDLCERLSISRRTISRALAAGDLEHFRLGARVVVPEPAAVAWLERCRIRGRAAA
jgi:excisionase family DNA binding protein